MKAYRITLSTNFISDADGTVRLHTRIVTGRDLTEAQARRSVLRRERSAHHNLPGAWWSSDIVNVEELSR